MSWSLGNLAGDVYINFLISILVEIFAYMCCALLSDRIGRRILHSFSLLIGGFAALTPSWIVIALAMIGKSAISAVFAQVFVYSSELYPTSLRTLALGVLNVSGTVGSMVSPYISDSVSIPLNESLGKKIRNGNVFVILHTILANLVASSMGLKAGGDLFKYPYGQQLSLIWSKRRD
ncbi:hypothetical protein KUTeg_022039 [Tegillarca granosa]|uniref:Major facilitator superfamily (MFS) profile domain-containing protein n=1 Tax=Tegillarca granosa TaxID=220873 RepID=A0ABQ9EAK4_TEGGR|nr:hypothetical protein KUTeg_022039 [Tegillarca granosa]